MVVRSQRNGRGSTPGVLRIYRALPLGSAWQTAESNAARAIYEGHPGGKVTTAHKRVAHCAYRFPSSPASCSRRKNKKKNKTQETTENGALLRIILFASQTGDATGTHNLSPIREWCGVWIEGTSGLGPAPNGNEVERLYQAGCSRENLIASFESKDSGDSPLIPIIGRKSLMDHEVTDHLVFRRGSEEGLEDGGKISDLEDFLKRVGLQGGLGARKSDQRETCLKGIELPNKRGHRVRFQEPPGEVQEMATRRFQDRLRKISIGPNLGSNEDLEMSLKILKTMATIKATPLEQAGKLSKESVAKGVPGKATEIKPSCRSTRAEVSKVGVGGGAEPKIGCRGRGLATPPAAPSLRSPSSLVAAPQGHSLSARSPSRPMLPASPYHPRWK
ncbi:hypothetical protein AAG570_002187 [Ranatra chinensis]|uniref:Uncharacterized protein n=1 Tax=Ranatra chinensis TaxID=642074 RepID=A0ABD0Y7T7_9HEMI